jgi:hypothetical protein
MSTRYNAVIEFSINTENIFLGEKGPRFIGFMGFSG